MTPSTGSVERAGRRLAARYARGEFLDRTGQAAVLVAGGPTLAGLLGRAGRGPGVRAVGRVAQVPDLRLHGPGDVWGWCWYASPGCCANGGLKKICDCCRAD